MKRHEFSRERFFSDPVKKTWLKLSTKHWKMPFFPLKFKTKTASIKLFWFLDQDNLGNFEQVVYLLLSYVFIGNLKHILVEKITCVNKTKCSEFAKWQCDTSMYEVFALIRDICSVLSKIYDGVFQQKHYC